MSMRPPTNSCHSCALKIFLVKKNTCHWWSLAPGHFRAVLIEAGLIWRFSIVLFFCCTLFQVNVVYALPPDMCRMC